MRKFAMATLFATFLISTGSNLASAQQEQLPTSGTFAIRFFKAGGSPFCDFMVVTVSNKVLISGIHDFSNCGLANAVVSGNFGVELGTPPFTFAATGANINTTFSAPTSSVFFLLDATGKWANYSSSGASIGLTNQGTYKIGPPPPQGSLSGNPHTIQPN